MWIRWAENNDISIAGNDVSLNGPDSNVLLPASAAVMLTLREILRVPRPIEALEEELAQHWAPARTHALLQELMDARVLVKWDLGPELVQLHQQTVSDGGAMTVPAVFETGRMFRESGGRNGISLPYPCDTGILLERVLGRRRTCREFCEKELRVDQLGCVLGLSAAAGMNGPPAPLVEGGPGGHRPYPSGGGLYPVEVLVYLAHVSGVSPGFYYYQALEHRLFPGATAQPEDELKRLLADQPIEDMAFLVLLWLDFRRVSLSKYGLKAYRLALLEAGHIAQNMLLVATALDLAALPLCGFDDRGLTEAAGLGYPEEPVVYALAMGSGVANGGDMR
jgi:SagB-type dehydrogenase family enzyme